MDPLNELLENVRRLNGEEKCEEVVELLTDVLLSTHNSPALYAEKAVAYLKLKDGVALFKLADKINASHPALALEQYNILIAFYNSVVEAKPTDTEACHKIAAAYQRLRQYNRSIEYFDRVIKIRPTAQAYYGLGYGYDELDQPEKAIHFLNMAVELDPKSADAYNVLGNIYKNIGKLPEAIANYLKVIEINPAYSYAYNGLGNAYKEQKNYLKAIEYYEKAIETDPTYSSPYNGLGIIYRELKERNKAIECYEKAIELDPSSQYPYNGIGIIYNESKDYEKAIKHYKKAIELDPGYEAPYNGLGNVYKNLKDYDKAIEAYKKSIELKPTFKHPYNGLGNVYSDQKEYDKAIKNYEKAIELDPAFSYPYNGLGIVYKELKDYDKAIENYKKSIELDPSFTFPYNGLGIVYNTLKEYDKAIEIYKKAIEIDPDYSSPYIGLGNVYLNLDQDNEAIENYGKAIELDPGYDIAYYNRALAYKRLERYKDALADYVKCVELARGSTDYYVSVAQSAIAELEKLIESPALGNLKTVVDNIKKILLFNGETITHYTSLTVAKILIITDDSSFLLSEGAYLNDTSEGRELFGYLFSKDDTKINHERKPELFAKKPFIGSFVPENKHDDLTLWRMYGKENKEDAKGCAITLNKDMFLASLKMKLASSGDEGGATPKDNEEFNFYRVAYRRNEGKGAFVLPGAEEEVEQALNEYMSQLAGFIKDFSLKENKTETDKQSVQELLNGIAYLFKSAEYQYEHELRLVVKGTGMKKIISEDWPPKVRIRLVGINPVIKKITLGPKVERADEWAAAFFYKLDKEGYSPDILISHLPFK